jgi:hypothetical protein
MRTLLCVCAFWNYKIIIIAIYVTGNKSVRGQYCVFVIHLTPLLEESRIDVDDQRRRIRYSWYLYQQLQGRSWCTIIW